MRKILSTLLATQIATTLFAQSTDAGATGNNWGGTKFLGWNTTNGTNPLLIKTNNITRMQINGINAGYGVNTSGFMGIGTTTPASPIHIVGSGQQNAQGWTRAITLSNSATLAWDGGGGAGFFMAHPSSTPLGNWYAGSQANLNNGAAVDYAFTVHVNTALGANPLRSTQIFKNLLVYDQNSGRRFAVNIVNPQAAADVYSNANQFRLSYGAAAISPGAASSYTDFFSNPNGRLQIMPTGGRVGINLNTDPTATLDVNGDARIRNVQTGTPNSILVGVNASGANDVNVRRLDFNGNSGQYLGGDGQFHTVSASTPPLANNGVSRNVLFNGAYQLGDVYGLNFPPFLFTNTPLTVNRQVRLNGHDFVFSGNGSVAVGLSYPTLPTEVFDVNGNARFRNVPVQGGQSIILGLQNGSNVDDIELSRLDFPNSSNVFLAGDGSWQTVNTTSTFGVDCSDNINGNLSADKKIYLNDHNFYFEGDSPTSNNYSVGLGWACGTPLKAKIDVYTEKLGGIGGSFFTHQNWTNNSLGTPTGAVGIAIGDGGTFATYYGVRGEAYGTNYLGNYGVYGSAASNANSYAGYFNGDLLYTSGLYGGSDSTLKSQITPLNGALKIVGQLSAKTFYWNTANNPGFNFSDQKQFGFISQEVQNTLPSLVKESFLPGKFDENGNLIENPKSYLALNYVEIIPINTQAIVELNQKVDKATLSDQAIKTNVQTLTGSLDKVLNMHGISYDWNHNIHPELHLDSSNHIGFIAQEMQLVDQRLTFMGEDSLLHVEYDKVVPVLAEAIKELHTEIQAQIPGSSAVDSLITIVQSLQAENADQQNQINDLNDRLTNLENCLSGLLPVLCQINQQAIQANTPAIQEEVRKNLDVTLSNRNAIILDQNVPNPFAEQTVINFSIPESVGKAQIHFYNMEGKIIQSVDINERGLGSLTVFGADLTSGIYTYSLIADGKIVATKRMIKE